ncbi:TonB-dependent receptor [Pedobacter hartonius]|uniref:TonB-dependent Receptor Plug Domain n=1 Tax=Pedobacter hartonius TaxID=425514 RepID=A0A1H3W829_9SPHI|nr:TonB-dependent receptor [Pedobacter hartonius]SDZ83289.1 TonB-dependent Receptor Plug Domain [Pedobacter hartonius]
MIISLLSKKKYAVYPNKHLKFITFLLVFLSIYKISRSQSQSGTVTVNYKNCTAQELLKELDRQSSYAFFFDPAQMNGIRLQNISYKNVPVKTVLEDLEKKTNLSFSTLNSNISVSLVTRVPVKKPEPGKLTGKILDEKGETFPSAGIRVAELGTGMQSSVDGTYTLPLPPGTYTIEISYVSYQTQRITGVQIKSGAVTKLDVSMKPAANALKEVVVTSGFQRASVAGLYARQKTAASVTDGISAAQIARTPDNNVGAVLKRISGLNVVDNRYVVVRGLSDRYNQAQIDGVTQPSTEMNQRNFAFDAIPAEMVSSVVVNKTATPDLSSEFAGGQVSVNTLDIPVQNFTQFQIGTGYNTNTIGKDFLQVGKRSGGELFGIRQEGHDVPTGLRGFAIPNSVGPLPDFITQQSRGFDPEGFRMYRYGFEPNQNYRLSFGRTYPLKKDVTFGFVGGATLRNSQEINNYISTRAGYGKDEFIDSVNLRQNGTIYKYNTTLSGLLNVGVQGRGFKLSLRNMYSHVYKNDYYTYEGPTAEAAAGSVSRDIRMKYNLQDPESTTVLQHKLEGEHSLGESDIKLTWNGSYTAVKQGINDRRRFSGRSSGILNGVPYYQSYFVKNINSQESNPDYRLYTDTKEKDFNWGLNLSRSFDFLKDKTLVKIGYSGFYKKRELSSATAQIFNLSTAAIFVGPYEYSLSPDKLGTGPGQVFYNVRDDLGTQFTGNAKSNSAYVMLDQSFFKKLRLVYGLRFESYKLANTQFQSKDKDVNKDDNTNYLPSANLTYSLTEKINLRASYATTVVRPDFRETSIFGLYDPVLDVNIRGANVKSTKINNTDVRLEWYPSPGEIISFSGFYKKFDKPIELVFLLDQSIDLYGFQNQKSATNYGLEMEFRKSLNFIADWGWLQNLSLFGNGAIIKSKVNALVYSEPGQGVITVRESREKRPLFGQSPWIVNAGISYSKDEYGLNLVYNKSGYRTNTINANPNYVEYEMGRSLVDLQLFTRLFKQRGELKLNVANLLNSKSTFYKNKNGYNGTGATQYEIKPGTSTKYNKDEGDFITYQVKTGSNISAAFTYRF